MCSCIPPCFHTLNKPLCILEWLLSVPQSPTCTFLGAFEGTVLFCGNICFLVQYISELWPWCAAGQVYLKDVQRNTVGISVAPVSRGSWESTRETGWCRQGSARQLFWSRLTRLQYIGCAGCVLVPRAFPLTPGISTLAWGWSHGCNWCAQVQMGMYKTSWALAQRCACPSCWPKHVPWAEFRVRPGRNIPLLSWEELQSHTAKLWMYDRWRIVSVNQSTASWLILLVIQLRHLPDILALHPNITHHWRHLCYIAVPYFLKWQCLHMYCMCPSFHTRMESPQICPQDLNQPRYRQVLSKVLSD